MGVVPISKPRDGMVRLIPSCYMPFDNSNRVRDANSREGSATNQRWSNSFMASRIVW